MRILLVTSRYLPHRGGLETVVSHVAQQYRRMGHEVLIVTSRYPRSLPNSEIIAGLPVERLMFLFPKLRFLRERRFDLFLAGLWYSWYTLWRLQRIIRRFGPDIVNLHYLGDPGLFLWLLHRWSNFPWVISLHGGDVDGEPHRSRFKVWLFRAAIRRADVVTACSRNLADQACQLAGAAKNKMQVIHNGVDWMRFGTAQPYAYERPYVVAVGQLVAHKGFDLLIRAFAKIAGHFAEVDLLIAGDGDYEKKLKELIQTHRLMDRVCLLGRVDEDMVASLMVGSLFVAMPSRREPFGIVALEGMAAARRVLATPVGGIPEFLPLETNRMVEPVLDRWIEALDDWLTLTYGEGKVEVPDNRLQAQGFTWKRVASQYLEVYKSVQRDQG
jgi:glycogen synthase